MNLNHLASTLARMDDPKGLNISVVDVKCVLAALGQYLRLHGVFQSMRVFMAIASRAGQRSLRVPGTELLAKPDLYDARFIDTRA